MVWCRAVCCDAVRGGVIRKGVVWRGFTPTDVSESRLRMFKYNYADVKHVR